ncbi:MAG: hypothetical protein C0467_27665 [Planctomycetaceae bacterium]|nr:hypothetical protein [Planctomycetaceae bacterium]
MTASEEKAVAPEDPLYAELKRVAAAANHADELARQHPDNLDEALRGAELFEQLCDLTTRYAEEAPADHEVKRVAPIRIKYHSSQAHKLRSVHAYEKHNCELALRELALEKADLKEAIRLAEIEMPTLSKEEVEQLEPQLQSWRCFLGVLRCSEFAIRAREARDAGRTIVALDWYRRTAAEAKKALARLHTFPPEVNPGARRIIRGNVRIQQANAFGALAWAVLDRTKQDRKILYDFNRDEGMDFLRHLLAAYDAGTKAIEENPEAQQMVMTNQLCRENIEEFLTDTQDHWGIISARYGDSPVLAMLMKHINAERYAMAKDDKVLAQSKTAKLWAYLSIFVILLFSIVGAICVLASVMNFWLFVPALGAVYILLLLIGGFMFRATGDLSQTNFLKLVGLAAKFQIRTLFGKKEETPKDTPEPTEASEEA